MDPRVEKIMTAAEYIVTKGAGFYSMKQLLAESASSPAK